MGVKGLWTLLEPVGKPVTLESLEGKVLAVDVSIWLHQTVHGMRDQHGDPVANAHLVGLFNRLCKLLFYKIKPIFVFDGGVPELKRLTLAARRQQRADATERSEQATRKMLTGLLKQHAVGSVLGNSGPSGSQPSTSGVGRKEEKADIYELPPMPAPEPEEFVDEVERALDVRATFLDMLSQEFQDPDEIDPQSEEFKALPPEVQYEVLTEMKEFRKQKRWNHSTEMPETSEDFSNFQLNRIMHRSRLTTRLDDVRKEINAAASGDMVMQLTGAKPGQGIEARRLVSDDSSHYILVKGLRKASEAASKISSLEGLREEDFKDGALLDTKSKAKDVIRDSKSKLNDAKPEINCDKDNKESSDADVIFSDSVSGHETGSKPKAAVSNLNRPSIIKYHSSDVKPVANAPKSPTHVPATRKSLRKATSQPQKSTLSKPEVVLLDSASDSDGGGEVDFICGDSSEDQWMADRGHRENAESRMLSDGAQVVPSDTAERGSLKPNTTNQPVDISHEGGFIRDESDSDSDVMDVNDVTNVDDVVAGAFSDVSEKETEIEVVSAEQKQKRKETDIEVVSAKQKQKETDIEVVSAKQKQKQKETDSEVVGAKQKQKETDIEAVGAKQKQKETDIEVVGAKQKQKETDIEVVGAKQKQKDTDIEVVSAKQKQKETDIDRDGSTNKAKLSVPETSSKSATLHAAGLDSESDDEEFEEVAPVEPAALEVCYAPNANQGNTEPAPLPVQHSPDSEDSDHHIVISDDEVYQEVLETIAKERNVPKPAKKAPMSQETEEQLTELQSQMEQEAEQLQAERGRLDRQAASITDTMTTEAQKAPMSQETEEQLSELQSQLEQEAEQLQAERGRLDRQAASITDTMTTEAQELLRLFGVPYLVSPMEAEAQCAQLDLANQTEGTITDDSDIWLFGGGRVYKNMFNQGKFVEHFSKQSIESQLLLDRMKLINIAFLCGSDYTPGIERVGPVTAMEILAEFPGEGPEQLRGMKTWWNQARGQPIITSKSETKIKQKVRQLKLPSGFPSQTVVNAYLKPEVDDSEERFTWGKPDLDLLRAYATEKMGWSQAKTDDSLLPVLKKLGESSTQRHITSFFNMDFGEPRKLKSKRVKQVLNKLQTKNRTEMNSSLQPSSSSVEETRSVNTTRKASTSPQKSPSKSSSKPPEVAKSGKRQATTPRAQPPAKQARRGRGGARGGAQGGARGGRRGRGRKGVQATPRGGSSSGRQMVDEVNLSESSSGED